MAVVESHFLKQFINCLKLREHYDAFSHVLKSDLALVGLRGRSNIMATQLVKYSRILSWGALIYWF